MRTPTGQIQAYQRAVSLGVQPNARVEAPGNANTYGAGIGQAVEGLGGALQKTASVVDKIQEDKVASDVLAAQNEYQKKLSDALYAGDNALLATNGENAAKADEQYKKIESQIRQEVTAKLPQFELAHTAFNRAADKENLAGAELINRHKQAETEKAFLLNIDNGAATTVETTSRNYNNPVEVQRGLDRIDELGNVLATNSGAAAAEAFKRKGASGLLDATMGAAYAKDDFQSMQTLLEKYPDKIGPESANKWTAAITERQKKIDVADTLGKLKSDPNFKDANGFFDVQKGLDYLRGLKKTTTIDGTNVAEGMAAGWKAWGDQHMDNGRVGCAEAVGKIGGFYSPFLAQEAKDGVVYVPTMIAHANKPGGPGVIDFDANKVQAGDCIVYGDDDHVVIADGQGGFYGNSSDANGGQGATIHGNDYTAMGGQQPTKIIKTGNVPGDETREEPKYDEAELAGFEQKLQAIRSDDIQAKNQRDTLTRKNVLNWLATNDGLPTSEKIDFINASGLEPADAKALSDNLIAKDNAVLQAQLKQSSSAAEGELKILRADGTLTVKDVLARQSRMTSDKFDDWYATAVGDSRKNNDEGDNAADKTWISLVRDNPVYGSGAERNALIGSTNEILDVENLKGTDRIRRANELIEAAKDKKSREFIAGYHLRNQKGFNELEAEFPGATTLINRGNNSDNSTIRIDGYEWKKIMESWADSTTTDQYSKMAWDYLFSHGEPINENVILRVRNRFAQESGAAQVDSLW